MMEALPVLTVGIVSSLIATGLITLFVWLRRKARLPAASGKGNRNDNLDELAQSGARRLLARALEEEVRRRDP
jgi:hypothetical protein